MPMGDSGGRSAGNRTGEGAKRRNTQRERAGIDPPWDEVTPRYQLTPLGETLRDVLLVAACAGLIFLMTLVLGEWFGAWNAL